MHGLYKLKIKALLTVVLFLFLQSCKETFNNKLHNEIKLFNGNNLDGWVNYGGGNFYVENNYIVAEPIEELPNTFLHTKQKYQDFELEFDVKLDTVLNSGVQIRSNIYQKETVTKVWVGKFDENGNKISKIRKWAAGRFWGYQIEIDPSSRSWSGALYEEGGRGFLHTPGINENVKSAFIQMKWNHFKIKVQGNHIQSWINGQIIADVYDDLNSNGYIALQLHGIGTNSSKLNKKIYWKNITLKKI